MVEISFPVVPEANNQILSEKQEVDYRSHRRDFIEWLLVRGKDPKRYTGYSQDTVKRTAYRCGKFDRFIWEKEDRYSVPLNHDHAETYMDYMAYGGHSKSHLHNTQLALIRYFKWFSQERGGDPQWLYLSDVVWDTIPYNRVCGVRTKVLLEIDIIGLREANWSIDNENKSEIFLILQLSSNYNAGNEVKCRH